MKSFVIMLSLLSVVFSAMAQTEVFPKLEKVTVYPSSALVEKSITVYLKRGENQFVIRGNANMAIDDRIHFSSSEDWFLSSLNTIQRTLTPKEFYSTQLSGAAFTQYLSLKNQQDEVELKINNTQLLISTLDAQQAALQNLKAIRNTVAFDSIDKIKAQFDYQRRETQSIATARHKAATELADLQVKSRQLANEINRLLDQNLGTHSPSLGQKDIHLTIYSNKNINNAKIDYSYMVTGVSCQYSYDALFDEQRSQAIFALKATVSQNTGEHWHGCQLAFSTSEAGYAGFDSELPVYYLISHTPAAYRTKAAMNSTPQERNMIMADVSNTYSDPARKAKSITASTSSNLTLSREYLLNTPQSVYSLGKPQTLPLQRDTASAIFARFATPKNEEKVHFTALLPQWEQLGLLEVGCNVYLNNRFVSTSDVVTAGSGDTLRFSVGQDPNVLVKRKHTLSTPDKGLLSKEVTRVVTVSITIKNTKNEPIVLRLKDQVPISSDLEIKVQDINPAGGTLNKDTGTIRWIVPMQPLEQRTITFSYTVKYPKEKDGTLVLQ